MKQLRGLDLKRAQLVPSSVFASPEDVVRHEGLSTVQKLAILRRWEFDARRNAGCLGVAARDTSILFRVRRAIQSLTYSRAARWTETVAGDREVDLPVAGDDPLMVANSVLAARSVGGKH